MKKKKKGETRRKKLKRKKEKYETDFSQSMAADGGERIRTFCSLSIIERFVRAVFLCYFRRFFSYCLICVRMYISNSVPAFVKNAEEKN